MGAVQDSWEAAVRKLIFVLSVIAFILVVLMLAQAARAESAPDATCELFYWGPTSVTIVLHNASKDAARIDTTFWLLIYGPPVEEYLTGTSGNPPTFIGNDAYMTFYGVNFLTSDHRIRDVRCISYFVDGSSVSVASPGPWYLRRTLLPVVRK